MYNHQMKKLLFSMLALLASGPKLAAQTISVEDVEILAGSTSVTIALHVQDAADMTSMHFEISDPSGSFTILSASATPSWTAIFSTGTEGISAISTSDNAFTGEGDVASVKLSIAEGTTIGTYPISITSVRVNGSDVAETSFNVTITDRITLDETSTTPPVASEGAVNVLVKRSIKADEWSTICLPFAMTEEQVKEAFGEEVQLADFDGCDTEEDGDDNTVGITVKFNEATAIEANHPYIIKVTEPLTQFTANGVTIEPEDEAVVTSVALRTGSGTKKDPYVYFYDYFTGSYVANTEVPTMALFLSGGKFYYSAGKNRMKAFRAYFELYFNLTDVEETYAGENVKMAFNKDGGTTRIGEMVNDKWSNGQCFDLSGRAITRPHTKGVYVIDGRKVVR
jgi:hypothetical protein